MIAECVACHVPGYLMLNSSVNWILLDVCLDTSATTNHMCVYRGRERAAAFNHCATQWTEIISEASLQLLSLPVLCRRAA